MSFFYIYRLGWIFFLGLVKKNLYVQIFFFKVEGVYFIS